MWVFFVFSFFAATSLGVKDKMRHFTKWLPKPVPAEIKHDSLVNDRRILHWDKNQWIFQRLRVFRLFKIQNISLLSHTRVSTGYQLVCGKPRASALTGDDDKERRKKKERGVLGGVVQVHPRRLHPVLPHQQRCSYQNLEFERIFVELHFNIRIPLGQSPNLQGRGILQGRRRRRWGLGGQARRGAIHV